MFKNHPYLSIVIKHTFTLFNFVNLVLALMIISVGSYKNMLFVGVAILNTLIGIINSVRAQRIVDKLRLLSEKNPIMVKDGEEYEVKLEELNQGDEIRLKIGDQVLCDSTVTSGIIEVNESFITGEQESIVKKVGDELISGSFVVAGSAIARVENSGDQSFVKKLENSAHDIKTSDSKLFGLMNRIVKYISYTLIPVGALLLWARFRTESDTVTAVTSTVAALINMIPEGLVLLTSSVLALATVRLGRRKVLVHDLYSIETLARVDCICLDKTGTLTTGRLRVKDWSVEDGDENGFKTALELILAYSEVDNATSKALKLKFLRTAKIREIRQTPAETIPFSSERKFSGVKVKNTEYLMGAAEFILSDKSTVSKVRHLSEGYRTIVVVKRTPTSETLLGVIRLEDEIRKDAPEIINYFYENDVKIKLISGDDLGAVTSIAEKVGIKDLKGVELSSLDKPNYQKLAKECAIFARVTPAEKRELIKAFKKQGNTVAMTGDGVNDILAMKEADCSIAIGEGSDAARRSAKIVLLKSDFAAVPSIIDEGRQSINNLERSTTLFLAKTVYATILAVLFVFLPLEYPYTPIEMTVLNFLCIGFPGLALALEKNTTRIKNKFISNILEFSTPVGLTISIAMVNLAIISNINNFSRPELTAASLIITFVINLALIFWISKPINFFRTALLALILLAFFAVIFVPIGAKIIDFTLNPGLAITIVTISLGSLLIFELSRRTMRRASSKIIKKIKF